MQNESETDLNEDLSKRRLDNFLNYILTNENANVSTFLLTEICSRYNMCVVKINDVSSLQWFSERTTRRDLKHVKTQPVTLSLQLAQNGDVNSDGLNESASYNSITVNAVPKFYLNGYGEATNKWISFCMSIVKVSNENATQEDTNSELIVSVFLKNPEFEERAFKKTYRMSFSSALESDERGIVDYISKKDFQKFIDSNDVVTFGVKIQLV